MANFNQRVPRIGDTFNPWRGACGFYAPDLVGRRRDLTDGQKRVYERLVRFAGQDGRCFPSQRRLEYELGKTERQIRKDIARLLDLRLIDYQRPDRRGSNRYVFLWHEMFETHSSFSQETSGVGLDRNSSSSQPNPGTVSTGTPVPHGEERLCNLRGTPVPANSVQEFYTENSSSFGESPQGGTADGESDAVPTTTSPVKDCDPEPESLTPEQWPTGDDREAIRRFMGEHRGSGAPDLAIVGKVAAGLESRADFESWSKNLAARRPGTPIKSFGFYLADVTMIWPQERERARAVELAEALAEQRAAEADRECDERMMKRGAVQDAHGDALQHVGGRCVEKGWRRVSADSDCLKCAGYGRDPITEQYCSCSAGVKLAYCKRCRNEGIEFTSGTETAPPRYHWCSCHHAEAKRADKGQDYLDGLNAEQQAFWQRGRHKSKSPNLRAVPKPAQSPQRVITQADIEAIAGKRPAVGGAGATPAPCGERDSGTPSGPTRSFGGFGMPRIQSGIEALLSDLESVH